MDQRSMNALINMCQTFDQILGVDGSLKPGEYWGIISIKNMLTGLIDESMMNKSVVTEKRINTGYSTESFTSKVWMDAKYPFPTNVWKAMFYIGETKDCVPLTWVDLELFNYIASKYPVVENPPICNASNDSVTLWKRVLDILSKDDSDIKPSRDLRIILLRFYTRRTILQISNEMHMPTSRVVSIINNTMTKIHRFLEGDYIRQGG